MAEMVKKERRDTDFINMIHPLSFYRFISVTFGCKPFLSTVGKIAQRGFGAQKKGDKTAFRGYQQPNGATGGMGTRMTKQANQ